MLHCSETLFIHFCFIGNGSLPPFSKKAKGIRYLPPAKSKKIRENENLLHAAIFITFSSLQKGR